MTKEEAIKELARRPDSEQALAKYNDLLAQIRSDLVKRKITGDWVQIVEGGVGGCSEFGDRGFDLNAENRSTPIWSADQGISDERWPEAYRIIREIINPAGFTTEEVMHDEPGDHDLFIQGPDGSILHVASQQCTAVAIDGGCHRLPDKPIDPHP